MSYVKVKGIVIREVNLGEADKILTIITKTKGKISAVAKGVRRSRSKLIAGSQLLCYSDFVLFKGKGMYYINSCEVIEPFYEIRNDIIKLTYSAHMVEILSDVVQENQPSSKTLQFFLNTLYLLSRGDRNPELIARVFELRLLSILGYAPYVNGCMICGSEDLRSLSFSFSKCGFICSKEGCRTKDEFSLNILPGTARAVNHIVNSRLEDLFRFETSPEVLEELKKISFRYLSDRLERDYRKLDFLKTLS
ncbi:MAG: DNA repair protein RecO [Acetivibrionales bacterium]|jgi:DNA repair protein RecO (recombination protein O)